MKRHLKARSGLCGVILSAVMLAAMPGSAHPGPNPGGQAQTSAAPSASEDLRNPDPKVRAKTARELGQSGDPAAVPALAAALNDNDVKVRREVVIALASIRVSKSLDALISATTDSDEEVRWLAVRGIEGYYTGSGPKSGAGFMGFMEKQYRTVKGAFVENHLEVPPGTAVSLRASAALDRVMMDPRYPKAAREATRGLGILRAQEAVNDLITTAHSSDSDLAREALSSLGKIRDLSAGPKLVDLLDSSSRNVQKDAAVTVGILRTRSAIPKLQSLYENNPHKDVRQAALEGLGYIGDPVSGPIFLKALWSSDAAIRASAAEGLGRSKYQQGLSDLLRAAPAEKNDATRLAMEFAITALGRNDYLATLIAALGSSGETAQTYLVELARDPKVLSELYPYMDSRDTEVRRRLCNVLMYSGDQSSLQPLEQASHDHDGSVAAAALRAMSAVRRRASSSPSPSSR